MPKTKRKIKQNWKDNLFDIVNTLLLLALGLVVFYPLYFILIASFSDPMAVNNGQVIFFPKGISLAGYERIFQDSRIWTGYFNTIVYTVAGTLLGVTITILAAYPLSRADFFGRKLFTAFFVFTMYFSGGLIPTFLLINQLNLYNTRAAVILLGCFSVWNLIVAKSFFQTSIPNELYEAASIDGCGNFKFFYAIALPLSKAVLAVISLYIGVSFWNQFFNPLIYLSDASLQPLQIVLRNILVSNQMIMDDFTSYQDFAEREMLAEYIKYGVVIVSTLPVLVIYPFLQRYFVKGVTIGSVKG